MARYALCAGEKCENVTDGLATPEQAVKKLYSNPVPQACNIRRESVVSSPPLPMSNSPTLPPAAGPQRKPTPLPSSLTIEREARLEAALAASARAEASLTGLFRAIQHLGNGVGGAREANESLAVELEALRDMLGAANEQQHMFAQKVEQLESVLDRTRREHSRERAFLIDQQDTFLVRLLDDQEAELKRRDHDIEVLRGRLVELERRQMVTVPPPLAQLPSLQPQPLELVEPRASEPQMSELDRAERAELERTAQKLSEDRERARETVARLQAQRDEAQSAVARISKERDDALQQIHRLKSELGGPRIPHSTRPPASETPRDQARAFGHTLTLDQLEMEARLNRPTAPSPASSPTASSPTASSPTASSPVSSSPPSSPRVPAISSVLNPPRSNPNTAPLPTRLSPPPTRQSPPPAKHSLPPEELRRALTSPPSVQSAASSRPPLKQKPDPSTRPLVGYSVNESIEAEQLEGVRLSSRPAPQGSGKR